MNWLLGHVDAAIMVPSAALVLWSALFIGAYFMMNRKDGRLIAWGLALAVLALHPVVHWLAALSIKAACVLLWCVQMVGAAVLVAGLLRDTPNGRLIRVSALIGAALTALAIIALAFIPVGAGISAWLAAAFITQTVILLAGTVTCAAKNWRSQNVPAYICLMLFALVDAFCAWSLITYEDIEDFTLLFSVGVLLVCSALSFALLIQKAVEAFRTNNRLTYIVENSLLGLVFEDEAGRIVRCNARMLKILAIEKDSVKLGHTTLDGIGMGEAVRSARQNGGMAETVLDFDDLRQAGVPTTGAGHVRLVVTTHDVDEHGDGLKGWHIQIEDVTRIRDTLTELTEKRGQLELILRAAGAYEYRREGTTIRAPELFESLGYAIDMRTADEMLEIVHPQDQGKMFKDDDTEGAGPEDPLAADIRLKNVTGDFVWFHLYSQIENAGGKTTVLGIALNIDLQKRLESHAAQCDRLAAAGQLANGLAHDINNHLSTIQTSLGMLTAVEDDELRSKYISYMREAVYNASGILKRLVGFSKGDADESGPVDLGEMLASSVELLRRSAGVRNTVQYDGPEGAEIGTVLGNYFDLQNAVLNIGLNARDALPEKGGQIRVRAWMADANALSPRVSCRWAFISIKDNGCGMSAEVQKRIFDPFFTTKPKGRGTGLGLYTTYNSVLRCGGTISVESAPGKGAEFILAFPVVEEKPALQEKATV